MAAGTAMGELASPDRFEDTEQRQHLVKLTRQAHIKRHLLEDKDYFKTKTL